MDFEKAGEKRPLELNEMEFHAQAYEKNAKLYKEHNAR